MRSFRVSDEARAGHGSFSVLHDDSFGLCDVCNHLRARYAMIRVPTMNPNIIQIFSNIVKDPFSCKPRRNASFSIGQTRPLSEYTVVLFDCEQANLRPNDISTCTSAS